MIMTPKQKFYAQATTATIMSPSFVTNCMVLSHFHEI